MTTSTEIRFSRGFEFARVESPREELRGIEGCICPTGLGTIYCVSDDFTGTAFSMCLIGACAWCGFDTDAVPVEERRKAFLAIVPDVTPCQWIVTFDDGITSFYKPWDGGNPEGDYYDSGSVFGGTISLCETACIACECVCPPADAPTSIEISMDVNRTVEGSGDCGAVDDIGMAWSFDQTCSLTFSGDPCISGICSTSATIQMTNTPGPGAACCLALGFTNGELFASAQISYDCGDGWHITLNLIETVEPLYCGLSGMGEQITDLDIPLGFGDPVGTYDIDILGSDRVFHVTLS